MLGGWTVLSTYFWQVIDLADCDVYSYVPEFEGDPFIERGAM